MYLWAEVCKAQGIGGTVKETLEVCLKYLRKWAVFQQYLLEWSPSSIVQRHRRNQQRLLHAANLHASAYCHKAIFQSTATNLTKRCSTLRTLRSTPLCVISPRRVTEVKLTDDADIAEEFNIDEEFEYEKPEQWIWFSRLSFLKIWKSRMKNL